MDRVCSMIGRDQKRLVLASGLPSVPSSAHSLSAWGLTLRVLSFNTCLMISSILKFISSYFTFSSSSFSAIFQMLLISQHSSTCTNDLHSPHSPSSYSNFQEDWSQTTCCNLIFSISRARILVYNSSICALCLLASFLCLSMQTSYFLMVFYRNWMPLFSYSMSVVADTLSFYKSLSIISGSSSDRKSTFDNDRECFMPERYCLWRGGEKGSVVPMRCASQMRVITSSIPSVGKQGYTLHSTVFVCSMQLCDFIGYQGNIWNEGLCSLVVSYLIYSSLTMISCCCWTSCSERELFICLMPYNSECNYLFLITIQSYLPLSSVSTFKDLSFSNYNVRDTSNILAFNDTFQLYSD